MDWVVKGIMCLVILGVIYGIYNYIDSSLEDHYVTPVKAQMQLEIDNQKHRAENAENANAGLQVDLGRVQATAQTCSNEVVQLKKDGEEASRLSDKAMAKVQAESLLRQTFIKDLISKASGAPTPGDFCEQAKKAYGILVDLARSQRMRDESRDKAAN